MMDRRRALIGQAKGRLPSEYQEVEWIKSDGNAYIDLSYVPTVGERYELSFYNASHSGDKMLFGADATYAECYIASRFYGACIPSKYSNVMGNTEQNINLILVMNANQVSISSSSQSLSSAPTSSITDINTKNMLVFRWNRSPAYGNDAARIYYFKIFKGDALFMYLVPCYRKNNNEIGMYDIVRKNFYVNAGSGNFTKGEDIE